MKAIFSILVLALLASGCTTPSANTPAPETPRTPASTEMDALKDQYGDAMVFFCTETTAVVSIDPNKCGEAIAKGANGCTEMAHYSSQVLKVDKQAKTTDLLSQDGKVLFSFKPVKKGFVMSGDSFLVRKPVTMSWVKITDRNQLSQADYYCNRR